MGSTETAAKIYLGRARQPWGGSLAAVPSLASFSGAQNAGFRNTAEGGERPVQPLNEGCVSLPVVQLWH